MRSNPHPVTAKDYRRAQELRQTSSLYETKLWKALQQNAGKGKPKFRRQQPIHPYIADFACLQARLLIELDGFSHDVLPEQDRKRDAYLIGLGYLVMRFSNDDIRQNLDGVVESILKLATERLARNFGPPPVEGEEAKT